MGVSSSGITGKKALQKIQYALSILYNETNVNINVKLLCRSLENRKMLQLVMPTAGMGRHLQAALVERQISRIPVQYFLCLAIDEVNFLEFGNPGRTSLTQS